MSADRRSGGDRRSWRDSFHGPPHRHWPSESHADVGRFRCGPRVHLPSKHLDPTESAADTPQLQPSSQVDTAGFFAAVARKLPPSDVWCILYPSLRTMLSCDILEITADSCLAAALPPVKFLAAAQHSSLIVLAFKIDFGGCESGSAPKFSGCVLATLTPSA